MTEVPEAPNRLKAKQWVPGRFQMEIKVICLSGEGTFH